MKRKLVLKVALALEWLYLYPGMAVASLGLTVAALIAVAFMGTRESFVMLQQEYNQPRWLIDLIYPEEK